MKQMLLKFGYPRTTIIAIMMVVFAGLALPGSASAQDGSVEIDIYKAGFIIGGGGGSGVLKFKGKGYPFDVGGISLGATIGISKTELIGQVYNLSKVEDLAGTYTAVSGSAVLGGGVSSAELKNGKGVRLQVQGRSIGFEFSLDLSGLQIKLR